MNLDILQRQFYIFESISQIDCKSLPSNQMELAVTHMKLPKNRFPAVAISAPILGNGISVSALQFAAFEPSAAIEPSAVLEFGLLDRLMIRLRLIIGQIE